MAAVPLKTKLHSSWKVIYHPTAFFCCNGSDLPGYSSFEKLVRGHFIVKNAQFGARSAAMEFLALLFEDDNGRAPTINECYIVVLETFYRALGRRRGVNRAQLWFQWDRHSPSCSNATLAWLQQHFEILVGSHRHAVEWASHGPDLNAPDF